MKKILFITLLLTACTPSNWETVNGEYSQITMPTATKENTEYEIGKTTEWEGIEKGNYYSYSETVLNGAYNNNVLAILTNNMAETLKGEITESRYKENCRQYLVEGSSKDIKAQASDMGMLLAPGKYYFYGKTCINNNLLIEANALTQVNQKEAKQFINSLKLD